MTVLNSIIPGRVLNRGINDRSIPEYEDALRTYPLHMPIVQVVTPKGPVSDTTNWIPIDDFEKIYGDIFTPNTPYYNPVSQLILAMQANRQSTIGVRRLVANKKMSSVVLSAFIQRKEVTDYARGVDGNFKYDDEGERIVLSTIAEGLSVVIREDPEAGKHDVGEMKVRTIKGAKAGDPDTLVYPMFEFLAGIGSDYNNNGLTLGNRDSKVDWLSVTDFVNRTGVFPYQIRQFTDNTATGIRTFVRSKNNADTVQFSLFDAYLDNSKYGPELAVQEYTGANINRPVQLRAAPFNDIHVYKDNLELICQLMYACESKVNNSLLDKGPLSYRQMNPFGCVNHTGSPYHAIEYPDTMPWDLTQAFKAKYGLDPFYIDEGVPHTAAGPSDITDPFNVINTKKLPLSVLQGWNITNSLLREDLYAFINSLEMVNTVRNRVSFYYDVGFQQPVKDLLVDLLGARQDIFLAYDLDIWNAGKPQILSPIDQRLSQANRLVRRYKESETWGTATCRVFINTIQAKVVDETSALYFSGNIDFAYVMAGFAGNINGILYAAKAPDHGAQRIMRYMHSPLVEFDTDDNSATYFDKGAVVVRPYDDGRSFRPGIPTVYTNVDSVLKDFTNVFGCICVEKLLQDRFNLVCGDSQIGPENYAAVVKDGGERDVRDRLGGIVKNVRIDCSYNEKVQGGRAVLNTVAHVSFDKANYMMTLDLYSYNAQDGIPGSDS